MRLFPNHVYRLKKALCGLKQAPRACRPDLHRKSLGCLQFLGAKETGIGCGIQVIEGTQGFYGVTSLQELRRNQD
ncbi:hypothetical protein Tco_0060614 [Tanacetum coccineum]